jgi:hypothetical protein
MRICCPHCGGKAVVTNRHQITAGVADVYCSCKNKEECGARFVATIAVKHTLRAPLRAAVSAGPGEARSGAETLTEDERLKRIFAFALSAAADVLKP